jgi:hypothetical protein
MTTIEQKNNSYIVYLQTNPNIDMTKVYNQSFFSIFPLKGLRVFKDNVYQDNVQEEMIETPSREIVESISEDNDESDKIIETFGPETAPNNYTELPLQTNTDENNIELDEKNNTSDNGDDDDEPFYSNLSGYLTKYLPNVFSREKDNNNDVKGMKIIIPYDVNYPVYLFNEYIQNLQENDFLTIPNTSLKYDDLHILFRDLFIQIEYFKNVGYMFDKFEMNKIVKIFDRFVYLDSENVVLYNEENNKNLHKTFLNLVRDLLQLNNNDEVCTQIKNIQHTQLFYFIKRVEREGIMLWI